MDESKNRGILEPTRDDPSCWDVASNVKSGNFHGTHTNYEYLLYPPVMFEYAMMDSVTQFVVKQGTNEVISNVNIVGAFDDLPTGTATLRWKSWTETTSGGYWSFTDEDPIEFDFYCQYLLQKDGGTKNLFRPISGNYDKNIFENFFPFLPCEFTTPAYRIYANWATSGVEASGEMKNIPAQTLDITTDFMLTSQKNSDVKVTKIIKFYRYGGTYEATLCSKRYFIFFDGNVKFHGTDGLDLDFSNFLDATGIIRTVATWGSGVAGASWYQAAPYLKSWDGTPISNLPMDESSLEAAAETKNVMPITYQRKFGCGAEIAKGKFQESISKKAKTRWNPTIKAAYYGTEKNEYQPEDVEDWGYLYRMYPKNYSRMGHILEWSEGKEAVYPFRNTQYGGSFAYDEIGDEGEPTGLPTPVPTSEDNSLKPIGNLSFPAQAYGQGCADPIGNHMFYPASYIETSALQSYAPLDVEIVAEITTPLQDGTLTVNPKALVVRPIVDLGDLAIPILSSHPGRNLFRAFNHRIKSLTHYKNLRGFYAAGTHTSEQWVSYTGYDLTPWSANLTSNGNATIPILSARKDNVDYPNKITGINVSSSEFLLIPSMCVGTRSSLNGLINDIIYYERSVLEFTGWQVGDRITLFSRGVLHREATKILPLVNPSYPSIYAGGLESFSGSQSADFFLENVIANKIAIKSVWPGSVYGDKTGAVKIYKVTGGETGGGYYISPGLVNSFELLQTVSWTKVAGDNRWVFYDLDEPLEGNNVIFVTQSGVASFDQYVQFINDSQALTPVIRGKTKAYGGLIHSSNSHIT